MRQRRQERAPSGRWRRRRCRARCGARAAAPRRGAPPSARRRARRARARRRREGHGRRTGASPSSSARSAAFAPFTCRNVRSPAESTSATLAEVGTAGSRSTPRAVDAALGEQRDDEVAERVRPDLPERRGAEAELHERARGVERAAAAAERDRVDEPERARRREADRRDARSRRRRGSRGRRRPRAQLDASRALRAYRSNRCGGNCESGRTLLVGRSTSKAEV